MSNMNTQKVNTIPTFATPSIILRGLEQRDAQAWFAYLRDPDVIALTSYPLITADGVQQMVSEYLAAFAAHKAYKWAIIDSTTSQLLGTIGFHGWDTTHRVTELGYDLAKPAWGQGIMSIAVPHVIHWAFTTQHMNRIQACVMPTNIASIRILKKYGFHQEGLLRQYKICRGIPCDYQIYALLAEEYLMRS
jgi:ribosomal-protein-alanine N-acetyltransferase